MAAAGQEWAVTLTAEKEGQAASFRLHQDVSRNLSEFLNSFGNCHCILTLLNTLFKLWHGFLKQIGGTDTML